MRESFRESVQLDQIVIGNHRRAADPEHAKVLAASIEELGLLEPIGLTTDYHLIYGLHRIEAQKLRGRKTIDANIMDMDDLERQIACIDENLCRKELTKLERVEQLARRKELFDARHPERRGGAKRSEVTKSEENFTCASFAEQSAAHTGVTPRQVYSDLQISRDLEKNVRDIIRDSPIANNKAELHALASLPATYQLLVAQKIANDPSLSVDEVYQSLLPVPSANGKPKKGKGRAKSAPKILTRAQAKKEALKALKVLIRLTDKPLGIAQASIAPPSTVDEALSRIHDLLVAG